MSFTPEQEAILDEIRLVRKAIESRVSYRQFTMTAYAIVTLMSALFFFHVNKDWHAAAGERMARMDTEICHLKGHLTMSAEEN